MNGILTDCFLYIRAAVKKLSSTLDHFLQSMYVCKACIYCNVSWTVVLKSSLENATFIPLLNPIMFWMLLAEVTSCSISTFTVHHSVQESVSWAWIPFGFKCFWCRLIPFALIKNTFTVFYSAQDSVSWVWIPQRLKYILVEVN